MFVFFNFFLCLFIFERERESMSGEGAEREGNTESETGFRLDVELKTMNWKIMT